MDSHIYRKAAFRLPALAGVAVLRFNTRGTASVQGTSEGAFDNGVGERYDVPAAIEYAEFARPAEHLAARLVVRDRPGADVRAATRRRAARSCSPRRCAPRPTRTWRRGPRPASRWSRWCPSTTTTCGRPRRASGSRPCRRPRSSPSPGAKHLWVGRRRDGAGRDRPPGGAGRRRAAAARVGRSDGDRRHQRVRRPRPRRRSRTSRCRSRAQPRRSRACQHGVCQCRRSSSPDAENIGATTGHATVCGVAGRITWWQPGQR